MNRECDFIMDLLSLYAEDMASSGTRKLVDAHLTQCESCKKALQEMEEKLVLPAQTDSQMLVAYNRKRIKRRILASLTVALVLLLAAQCVLICRTVPIWLTAEEAVQEVQELDGGKLLLIWSDDVNIDGQFGEIFASGLRWPQEKSPDDLNVISLKAKMFVGQQSLWYIGTLAGEEDTLLWGDSSVQPAPVQRNDTLMYLFLFACLIGALGLGLAILPWRGRRLLGWIGVLFLCCAAACWFVTAGRFATYPAWDIMLEKVGKLGMLSQRLIHIGILTGFSWGAIRAACGWLRLRISEKRGVSH